MYIIYGKDNCSYCDRAKHLLEIYNLDYKYLRMSEDYTREELLELAPEAKSMPQIWNHVKGRTVHIGGYNELVKYLDENNDVRVYLDLGVNVEVTFTKADGSERVMLCTTNPRTIQEYYTEEKKTERVIADNPDVCKVFDLDKKAWRSFRLDSVKSYKIVA